MSSTTRLLAGAALLAITAAGAAILPSSAEAQDEGGGIPCPNTDCHGAASCEYMFLTKCTLSGLGCSVESC